MSDKKEVTPFKKLEDAICVRCFEKDIWVKDVTEAKRRNVSKNCEPVVMIQCFSCGDMS